VDFRALFRILKYEAVKVSPQLFSTLIIKMFLEQKVSILTLSSLMYEFSENIFENGAGVRQI